MILVAKKEYTSFIAGMTLGAFSMSTIYFIEKRAAGDRSINTQGIRRPDACGTTSTAARP